MNEKANELWIRDTALNSVSTYPNSPNLLGANAGQMSIFVFGSFSDFCFMFLVLIFAFQMVLKNCFYGIVCCAFYLLFYYVVVLLKMLNVLDFIVFYTVCYLRSLVPKGRGSI